MTDQILAAELKSNPASKGAVRSYKLAVNAAPYTAKFVLDLLISGRPCCVYSDHPPDCNCKGAHLKALALMICEGERLPS